jgi:hypothetical protein
MRWPTTILYVLLGICFTAPAGPAQPAESTPLRLLLSEVQPGSMGTQQYCLLVLGSRHFHAEKASRKLGKDRERKVYEGQLSDADWTVLEGILDRKEFREMKVPQSEPPLVSEDLHPYTISVARETEYQNLEFLTGKSLRPYESQVKPLLQWWRALRSAHMAESSAPPDSRCTLDSTKGIFTN